MDLKAAFDNIDKAILFRAMREERIRESLTDRVKGMFRETKNRVREGENMGEFFWTAKGVGRGAY